MKKQDKWYYLTNQLNLGYSLARGLITAPEGYGDKYYSDLLQNWPGWLPLFPSLHAEQLEQVTRDAPHLVPVVLEMDLKALQGDAWGLNASGEWEPVRLPEMSGDSHSLLLLPLPLPISLFSKLYFSDAATKNDCIDRWQSQYRNIPIPDRQWLGTRKSLFQRKVSADIFAGPETPLASLPERPAIPLDHADTLGALRALLFHYAHRWKSACEYYEWLFLDKQRHEPPDRVLRQAALWRDDPSAAESANDEVGLFWFLVNRLRESDANATDVLLQAIQQGQARMPQAFQQRLQGLAATLRELGGLGDRTLDELFDENPKPFARALLLFFTRDSSRQLLEREEPLAEPLDVLYALILFAARDGWLALDRDLRHGARFIAETNDYMARLLQRGEPRLEWKPPSPLLLPLYRRLAPEGDARMDKKAEGLRLELARKMGWDCIHTHIQLPHGSYPMKVDRNGVEIVFSGEPRNISTRVDAEAFFQRLERTPLPADTLAGMLKD